MNKTKNKFFIALGVFFGAVALAGFALWQFLFAQLSLAQADYVSKSIELSEVSQKSDFKNDLKKEIEAISSDVSTIESSLLAEEGKLEFIQDMEDLAVGNGNEYSIKSVQEIEDPKTRKVQEIDFTLGLKGGFESSFAFLRGIKAMPYIINIRQINMDAQEDGVINTDLVIKVYLR